MKVEVTTYEFIDMLKKGSTNQKQLIENIEESGVNVYSAIEILEEELDTMDINEDPRGDINGGVLRFGKIPSDDNGEYILPVTEKYGFIFL